MALSNKVKYDFKLTDFVDDATFKNPEIKEEVISDVSDVVLKNVLSKVADGVSPVSGQGSFKSLNKKYAKWKVNKVGARPVPNLELHGSLLSSVDVQPVGNKIRLAVSKSQEEKADGHNQHSSKARSWARRKHFPRRPFIPREGEELKSDIVAKIVKIIQKGKERDDEEKGKK